MTSEGRQNEVYCCLPCVWTFSGPRATLFTADDGQFNPHTASALCQAVFANHIRTATSLATERVMACSRFTGPGDGKKVGNISVVAIEAMLRRGILARFGDPIEAEGMRFQKWRFDPRCLNSKVKG